MFGLTFPFLGLTFLTNDTTLPEQYLIRYEEIDLRGRTVAEG